MRRPRHRQTRRPSIPTSSNDYPLVRAWGRISGAGPQAIATEIAAARADRAPADACYRQDDGRWVTSAGVWAASTRALLGLDPLPAKDPDLLDITATIVDLAQHSARLHDLYGTRSVTSHAPGLILLTLATGSTLRISIVIAHPTAPLDTAGQSHHDSTPC